MHWNRRAFPLGLFFAWACIIAGNTLAVAQTPVELPWTEIAPLIVDREIALALPHGTYIRGKALAVYSDDLLMDIKKTSDSRSRPKGRTTIPRASVAVIELRKMRKFPLGAIAGGGAGYVGGAYLGYGMAQLAADENRSGEDIGGSLLGAAVGAVAGVIVGGLLGHKLDRRYALIKIIPEPPKTPLAPTHTGDERLGDSISGMPVAAVAALGSSHDQ